MRFRVYRSGVQLDQYLFQRLRFVPLGAHEGNSIRKSGPNLISLDGTDDAPLTQPEHIVNVLRGQHEASKRRKVSYVDENTVPEVDWERRDSHFLDVCDDEDDDRY